MISTSQLHASLFSQSRNKENLASNQLQDHDQAGKYDALAAVDILLQYKLTVHEFTDEIIEFWPLPRRVMDRYHFDDAEQLNDWLDNLS